MVVVAYVDSDGIERSHTIGLEPVLIGRAPECAIRSNDGLVSRNHARMYVDQTGMLMIEDLGSANGVFVGADRVTRAPIPISAVVVVGSLRFRRLAETAGPLPSGAVDAARPTRAVLMTSAVPVQAPLVEATPAAPQEGLEIVAHLLRVERAARIAVEGERDAYGARMAQLHNELAGARASLASALARIAELDRRVAELSERIASGGGTSSE